MKTIDAIHLHNVQMTMPMQTHLNNKYRSNIKYKLWPDGDGVGDGVGTGVGVGPKKYKHGQKHVDRWHQHTMGATSLQSYL